jgi:hypothetical protein
MSTYEVIDAKPEHVDAIARNVRQADIDEVWSAGAITITDGLKLSLENAAVARTWLIDGVPAALGGITKISDGYGIIWLITTDLVERHQRRFLVEARHELARVKDYYRVLFNWVDVRNARAIKWLQRMGFSMSEPRPHGVFRKPFHYFEWRAA